MDNLVRIKNDVFDVEWRLRAIDEGYYPVYNRTRCRYEIHHAGQKPSLCVVLPFGALDKRALDYVRRTRIERARELAKEIDEYNEAAERRRMDKCADEATYKAKHLFGYLSRSGSAEVPDYDRI